ncbi:hypothetical protein ACSBR1_036736 [Camellia fascicularis]
MAAYSIAGSAFATFKSAEISAHSGNLKLSNFRHCSPISSRVGSIQLRHSLNSHCGSRSSFASSESLIQPRRSKNMPPHPAFSIQPTGYPSIILSPSDHKLRSWQKM